jgi:DNA-binding MarR family transcriptional regulator
MEKAKKQTHGRGASEAGKVLTVTVPDLIDAGGDAEFREMISLIYAAVGRLTTMRRTLARSLGLTSAQFAVLMTLLRLGTRTGVKIRDIADDLYIAAANVTVTVGELEALGWLAKTSDPTDSRALAIKLTDKAGKRLGAFSRRLHLVNDRWFQDTSKTELTAVVSFFRQLIDRYDSALNAAREFDRRPSRKHEMSSIGSQPESNETFG